MFGVKIDTTYFLYLYRIYAPFWIQYLLPKTVSSFVAIQFTEWMQLILKKEHNFCNQSVHSNKSAHPLHNKVQKYSFSLTIL